ncbi:hypothetical protein GTY66_23585 [Streptomyces sp. SID8356]|uniref:hypothetical protein n=1 Tax=unclassified Streptomyces TaxID=2593676 RepID=UPI000366D60C|nr:MULTISPECIES: hypothetical protein [unclassified Streptomyces]MYT38996.1 hypothetical protein [Streptomyces sp. SID8356]
MTTQNAWPENVIARYLTVGGATVDLFEESGYYIPTPPTQTRAHCNGCGKEQTEEWGFSIGAHEYGREQPAEFDTNGQWATPRAHRWAQSHAETCRAIPKPA